MLIKLSVLPVGHGELNPIELSWVKIKGQRRCVHHDIDNIIHLVKMEETPERWSVVWLPQTLEKLSSTPG